MRIFRKAIATLFIKDNRLFKMALIVAILHSLSSVSKADTCEGFRPMIKIGEFSGTNDEGDYCSVNIKETGKNNQIIRIDIMMGTTLISDLILSCQLNDFDELFFKSRMDADFKLELTFQESNGAPFRFFAYENINQKGGAKQMFDCKLQ